jgi:rhodanese-related sulfurtransferase
MAAFNELSPQQLSRLIGLPDSPVIIDVRIPDDMAADPRLIPGAIRRSHRDVAAWAGEFTGRRVVVSCQKGHKLSQGVAAWLRHAGATAETLEGGHLGWAAAGLPLIPIAARPAASLWVTRSRPKVDRIACPWLIRFSAVHDALYRWCRDAMEESHNWPAGKAA